MLVSLLQLFLLLPSVTRITLSTMSSELTRCIHAVFELNEFLEMKRCEGL